MQYTEWIKEAQEAVGYSDSPRANTEYATDNGVDYYPKDSAGRGILSGLSDSVGEFWGELDPATKDALIGSLVGAGLGGLTGSVVGGTYSPEGEGLGNALSMGGLGALTGGLAGGLGGASLGLLGGGPRGAERDYDKPWTDSIIEAAGDQAVEYPFAVGGTVAGGISALNALANTGSDGGATWGHLRSHRFEDTVVPAVRAVRPVMNPDGSLRSFGTAAVPEHTIRRLRPWAERISRAFDDHASNIGRRGMGLLALPALAGLGYAVDHYIDGDR